MERTNNFIKKALDKHNNKYDYSLVNYINNYTKIKIICKEHGIFEQTPNNHLTGNGCIKCGYLSTLTFQNSKLNTDELIVKFIKKHKNRYDYSKVNYINSYTKVEIICKEHGSFFMRTSNHIKGSGCKTCYSLYSKKPIKINWKEDFIKKHGDRYDYSKSIYLNCETKIEVICREHGSFFIKPSNHLTGHNCYKCSFEVYDTETFIDKVNNVFDKLYDYSRVNYNGNKEKVEIICKEHGSFYMTPTNHINKQGCPKCKSSRGEAMIISILESSDIKFTHQMKFDDCRNLLPLPFDFYLPEQNICIEFDGKQHFEAVEWFGGEHAFEKLKERDRIKTDYCLSNGIDLLRIPYYDYGNIEHIIKEKINI